MKRQILKALIPYVEGDGAKPRPVVQLSEPSAEHNNFQIAYVTSRTPTGEFLGDIEISESHKDFALTGLGKTSFIRCSKIFTINPTSVLSVIGELSPDLCKQLEEVLLSHFQVKNK